MRYNIVAIGGITEDIMFYVEDMKVLKNPNKFGSNHITNSSTFTGTHPKAVFIHGLEVFPPCPCAVQNASAAQTVF